jgi:hypothetical protein
VGVILILVVITSREAARDLQFTLPPAIAGHTVLASQN